MFPKIRPLHACGLLILLLAASFAVVGTSTAPRSQAASGLRSGSGASASFRPSASPELRSRAAAPRRVDDASTLLVQLSRISDPGEQAEFVSATLRRLAASDPWELLSFAAGLPPGPLRTPTLLQALEASAAAGHADDAKGEAAQLLPPEEMPAAQLSIAAGWAESAPRDAMGWAGTLEDEFLRSSAVQIISAKWGEKEPAAALAWLDTQPDLPVWSETITAISAAWADSDPELALAWAKIQSSSGPDCPEPLHAVLREWSRNDPASTVRAFSLESVEVQRKVAPQLAANYARLDLHQAAAWAESLADPEVSREAVAAVEQVRRDVP